MGTGSGQLETGDNNAYRREPEMAQAVEDARKEAVRQAQADQDPEAIRREIEATRSDLSETVDAIQQRLNPQRLREEAASTVREATVGRVEDFADETMWKVKGAGYNMFETIKRNPIPAALVAIGMGWLVMETRSAATERHEDRGRFYDGGRYYEGRRYMGTGSAQGSRYGERGRYYGEQYYEGRTGGYPATGSYGSYEGLEQGQGRVQEATQSVKETASEVKDRAGQVAGQAREQVEDFADRTREQAGQVADEAQWRARQVKNRFSEMMDEKPLLIAAGAVALGAVVGFALPSTQKEAELFGEASDSFMERAQETASETMQKVQRVAEEAGTAAKEAARSEAENQGLAGQK